jgi:hypothetical protein
MHLDPSYAIWGGAFATLLTLLTGIFVVRGVKHLKQIFQVHHELGPDAPRHTTVQRDIENRVLMFLMSQKTDSMLSALAKTIEQERQKLGVVVRNPSLTEGIDACEEPTPDISDRPPTEYEQILPMVQNGIDTSTIARRLRLSEAEVSLVMRLNAA